MTQTPTTFPSESTQPEWGDTGAWVSKNVKRKLHQYARRYKMYYFNRGREAGFRVHWLGEVSRFADCHQKEKTNKVYGWYMAYTREHIPPENLWQELPWGVEKINTATEKMFKEYWGAGYLVGEFIWFVKGMPFVELFYGKRNIPKAYYEWLKSI